MRQAILLSFVLAGVGVAAQSGPSDLRFEVASVKPNQSGDSTTYFDNPSAAIFGLTNAEVRKMIAVAYEIPATLERFVLTGGPERVLSARFDVRAKPPDGATPAQRMPMLRALLTDRFRLRTHTETREVPVYALVVARDGRLGSGFRASTHDCGAWRSARARAVKDGTVVPPEPKDPTGRGWCTLTYDFKPGAIGLREVGTIPELITRLQAFVDRRIVDSTGLSGHFEWQVAFTPSTAPPIDSPVPSIFTALPEQLGLRLESRTEPLEVRIIDSVDMPTPD